MFFCMRRTMPKIRRFSQAVRFLRVTRLLLWTIWVIYRERRRVLRAHEKGNSEVEPNIDVLIKVLLSFRQTALELGVLMIKLGQFPVHAPTSCQRRRWQCSPLCRMRSLQSPSVM